MIGLERVLHTKQKSQPQNSEHKPLPARPWISRATLPLITASSKPAEPLKNPPLRSRRKGAFPVHRIKSV
jgi:hypothetical protein